MGDLARLREWVPLKRSAKVEAICLPRWPKGKQGKRTPKVDPCDTCPLFQPCIKDSVTRNESEYDAWILRINQLANETV